jgi:hypothetical protein
VAKTSRVVVSLPGPGAYADTSNSLNFPTGLSKLSAYLQLVPGHGKDTNPVRAGQPLVFSRRDGTRLFALTLRVHYDRNSGMVALRLRIQNLGVPRAEASNTRVVADVTVGYMS